MTTTNWADLNRDGRRLESLIKEMRSKSKTEDIEETMYLAYVDRIIKATNSKVNIAEIVLNIKKTLKDAQKVNRPGAIEIAPTG